MSSDQPLLEIPFIDSSAAETLPSSSIEFPKTVEVKAPSSSSELLSTADSLPPSLSELPPTADSLPPSLSELPSTADLSPSSSSDESTSLDENTESSSLSALASCSAEVLGKI